MVSGERWAAAFINALNKSGGDADKGLEALKALFPPIKSIEGSLSSGSAAAQLEGMIRTAMEKAGAVSGETETAARFLLLLIKKHFFKYAGTIIEKIELLLEKQKGVLRVTVESAFPPDGEFQEILKKFLIERTGSKKINILTRIVPELMGGCRLYAGGAVIDVSLRGQLQKMKADLSLPLMTFSGVSGPAGTPPLGEF
jgi:ATP synthase F1 delta subunit